MLKYIIVIQKLNNIIINHFQNIYISIISDKWQYNISQDCKLFCNNFMTFLITLILSKNFCALCFHIFTLEFFKDGFLCFKNTSNIDNVTLSLNTGLDCKL